MSQFHSHQLVPFWLLCIDLGTTQMGDFATSKYDTFSNVLVGFVDQNIVLITAHIECLAR